MQYSVMSMFVEYSYKHTDLPYLCWWFWSGLWPWLPQEHCWKRSDSPPPHICHRSPLPGSAATRSGCARCGAPQKWHQCQWHWWKVHTPQPPGHTVCPVGGLLGRVPLCRLKFPIKVSEKRSLVLQVYNLVLTMLDSTFTFTFNIKEKWRTSI